MLVAILVRRRHHQRRRLHNHRHHQRHHHQEMIDSLRVLLAEQALPLVVHGRGPVPRREIYLKLEMVAHPLEQKRRFRPPLPLLPLPLLPLPQLPCLTMGFLEGLSCT